MGTVSPAAVPGLRSADAHTLGTGMIDGRELSVAAAVAGADVIGLTYAGASHGEVAATCRDGSIGPLLIRLA